MGATQRIGMVINVKPEMLETYRALHADPWPDVLAALRAHHISNYSIFLRDGVLFSYFEYDGDDLDADMQSIGEDPVTQEWWSHTDPCQQPLESAEPGQWWAPAESVFFMS